MISFVPVLLAASALLQTTGEPPEFPRTPPTEAAASVAKFQTRDGFRMELIAAEPLIFDPVAAAYDEDGRLYVVEMSDYPHVEEKNDKPFAENTLDPPIGRLKRLVDQDGDGVFDVATVLADKLSWPTGLAVWKGGVFIAATPDVWYVKDADGDGRAEIRELVYEGFRKYNVQAVMNNLQWGLDHRIYGAGSSNGGQIRTVGRPDVKAVSILRHDFRFDPTTRGFEAISGGARFGNSFDDWGNRFLCNIRNPAEHVVLPAHQLARNPRLAAPAAIHDAAEAGDAIPMYRISPPEPWREFRARRWAANGKVMPRSELIGAGVLTSSSGITVYRGDAYPPEYRGQFFLGEVANNLVHREALEADGVTFRARRLDDRVEFVASTDTWFRPVNFVNAPDGALDVLDMYRETIEHPWSIPDDVKARLDLRSGEDRGRIYRLIPPNFRHRPTPKLSAAPTADLVGLLAHPNGWHRDTAHRLIFERQERSIVPALGTMLRESKEPLGRLHALWSLEGLGALRDDDLLAGLADTSSGVREHAVALAASGLGRSEALRRRVIELAEDPEIRVRFQVAFALGDVDAHPEAVAALAKVARRDADDLWVRTAVLSSAGQVAGPLFNALLNDADRPDSAGFRSIAHDLAALVGSSGDLRASASLLDRLAGIPVDLQEAAVLGLGEGLARVGRRTIRDLPAASPAARGLIAGLLERAAGSAVDRKADPAERERSIALLSQADFEAAGKVLGGLLSPEETQPIQRAAIRSLATFSAPEVGSMLLGRWRSLPPGPRSEILTRVLSRTAWTSALLDSIQAGTVPASVIPPARRALLLADRDPVIRERARKLLDDQGPGPRGAAYKQYLSALELPADRGRGEAVFERECTTCHKLGERGHAVGPNLASVQHRTPEEVLLHVLDPNREVSPDFLEYAVNLDDGRALTGLVVAESAGSLTLRRPGGEEDTVLRSNIESVAGTGKSLMPEGLEARISKQEMADLIAFILGIQQ